MKLLATLHIVFIFSATCVFAQEVESVAADSLIRVLITLSPGDTVNTSPPASAAEEEIREPLVVVPWVEERPVASSTITTDSLLRWQVWSHWGDYQAYRRDVISFRQGTAGRVDAFHINGFQPNEQQVNMEGISLNNPITGLVNYNLVPQRKIGEAMEEFRGSYHSEIYLRDYYLTQPISYLNYDESEQNYRNLEFFVARNFTEKTNLELSYWDRRDGDFYPNNDVEGSQVMGRLYHHLNEKFLVRAFYLRNQFSNNEPFGYSVPDPQTFAFDRFTSTPFSSNGNSEFRRWDLVSGIYHRKDTSSVENAGFEAIISKNKKDLWFIQDTLSWDLTSVGAKLFKSIKWQGFNAKAEVEGKQHTINDISVLDYKSWNTSNVNLNAGYQLGNILVYGNATINSRSDSRNGYELGGGIKVELADWLQFATSAFEFSRIPEMQTLYWQSANYTGNTALENEIGTSITSSLDLRLTRGLSVGASGRFKNAENTTFLSADSSFINSENYDQISATVYGRFENSLFEFESSATAQLFEYSEINSQAAALNNQDQIVWFRNSAFVKGYVFDRAAFLKFGVKTLLSPFIYASRTYNTELGYWQGNSTYHELPAFFRLDAEVSARVRRIMVVIRWENALDGIGQAGYFEAAGFPMPPRRLIVGIRAQFRN
ncbi:MAG: hypothetical protein WD059_01985 [Balneolaceae bacterium]